MISIVGSIGTLALLIYLALRGHSLLVITPLLAMLVAITSNMNMVEVLTGSYMEGFVNFAEKYFLMFLFGAIFGKIIEDSGAATSIAKGILKVTGTNSRFAVLAAMVGIVAFLTVLYLKSLICHGHYF